ncbi:hypothetical protein LLS1_26450 [Leifsonia sp. LS1]|uniref:hypothetical protein n=1 Tax=Leifsonia sp. LS1 TaxID=2828483 RepID=UPI001CFE45AF|nr:hypothetical protein [Leifsonia sp. LS1]GIT80976.1 hypothetical protein LLS1_26450 [Leifsonia sp. LS1]
MKRITADRRVATEAAKGIADALPPVRELATRFPGGLAAGAEGTEEFDAAFNDAASALAATLPAVAATMRGTSEDIVATVDSLLGADQQSATDLQAISRAF